MAEKKDHPMFAIVLTALFVLLALASLALLADSGLRWWSAIGQLRAQLKGTGAQEIASGMRPVALGGCAGFGRSVIVRPVTRSAARAAA